MAASHHFTPYPSISALRSQLLTNPPASVPSIEDLISLDEELKNLKNKSLARGRKADNDLKILEGLLRRNKEKEKDKGKLKDKLVKVKREATGTPDPRASAVPSSVASSVTSTGHGVKALPGINNGPSKSYPTKTLPDLKGFPSSGSGSGHSINDKLRKEKDRSALLEKDKKKDSKKKKRKREDDDSDVEEIERPKKAKRSPEPPNHIKQKSPSKINHHLSSGLHATNAAAPVASFTFPRHIQRVPQLPTSAPPPTPGPSDPRQVTEDFSKLKVPPQVAISNFWAYIEPWLRPIREEDVGLLEWDGDEETPFIMPPLGRHYTEIWEDEDSGRYLPAAGSSAGAAPTTASLPKWDPSTMNDADAVSNGKGHSLGPVHERLLSAMLEAPVLADGRSAAVAGVGNANGSGNGNHPFRAGDPPKVVSAAVLDERIGRLKPFEGERQPPKVNVQDMQERLIKELRSIGLLGDEEPNYAKSADDPLAVELRKCQRLLRAQMAANKARRRRLCDIAKARLARNEFEEHVGALERAILARYAQLQRRDMPKQPKKKKKSGGAGGGAHVVPDGPLAPPADVHPAGWGLERHEEEGAMLGVDEELDKMIKTRRQFVDVVQPCLDAQQRGQPGLMYGSPAESIYKGIVEERELKTKDGGSAG